MNIFLIIFVICIFLLVLRMRLGKSKDSDFIKLLCPYCDSIIAYLGLPSKTLNLLKAKEDLWLGNKTYTKVEVDRNLWIICPNCWKLIVLEEKKID